LQEQEGGDAESAAFEYWKSRGYDDETARRLADPSQSFDLDVLLNAKCAQLPEDEAATLREQIGGDEVVQEITTEINRHLDRVRVRIERVERDRVRGNVDAASRNVRCHGRTRTRSRGAGRPHGAARRSSVLSGDSPSDGGDPAGPSSRTVLGGAA